MTTGTRIAYTRKPYTSLNYSGVVVAVEPTHWLVRPDHAPERVHTITLTDGEPDSDIEWRTL